MDEFVKYVADIIEFLVGGILFIGAMILFLALFAPELTRSALDAVAEVPPSFEPAVTIAAVAVVYALGVIAEGISRVAVEWRLSWITRSTADFGDPGPQNVEERAALLARSHLRRRLLPCRSCARAARRRDASIAEDAPGSAGGRPEETSEGGSPTPGGTDDLSGLGERHRRRFRARARNELFLDIREEWRAHVEARSEAGRAAISAQLKRLRIERTFLLSSSLSGLTLLVAGHWVPAGLMLAVSVMAGFLVNERFDRYVHTIVRAYRQC